MKELQKARIALEKITNISKEATEISEIISSEMNLDIDSQIATLIYKSIPIKDVEISQISELFGSEIASLIENLLKIAKIPQKDIKIILKII